MTRWKREFLLWVEREDLWAFYAPKKPEDWAVAKQASRMVDQIARKPETQKRIVDSLVDDLLSGQDAWNDPRGIASWLG